MANSAGATSDSEVRRGLIRAKMLEMAQTENSSQDETDANQEPLEEEEEESILDEVFGAITRAARELRKMIGAEKDLDVRDPPLTGPRS